MPTTTAGRTRSSGPAAPKKAAPVARRHPRSTSPSASATTTPRSASSPRTSARAGTATASTSSPRPTSSSWKPTAHPGSTTAASADPPTSTNPAKSTTNPRLGPGSDTSAVRPKRAPAHPVFSNLVVLVLFCCVALSFYFGTRRLVVRLRLHLLLLFGPSLSALAAPPLLSLRRAISTHHPAGPAAASSPRQQSQTVCSLPILLTILYYPRCPPTPTHNNTAGEINVARTAPPCRFLCSSGLLVAE
mmetsp:Transcript_30138/g.92199  ORF Transcript_30138/g.92199 Transcript_30138/m.92199 type:complete len:246 (+) Transcript_30138:773-1510(+)